MKDLIVRILFKADDKAVKSQLKKTEQEAKKSANNISGSFKKAFGGLATSLAGLGLARIFKSAIDDAARLEQSLLKLQTAAKNTGQDFNTIREGLQKLRSEGVLSFQTITEASSQLLQQGFKADQIEPFLRALRNIGALENTVGDTNLAIQSFIRAISTNSLELVDNLSPALRKVVLDLGGFNAIAKDASKQQELFNITLERGNRLAPAFAESVDTLAGKQEQFATNTQKLSESLGQSLAPAFEVIIEALEVVVEGTTVFFNSLGPLGRALTGATAAATALGLALAFVAGPYVAIGAAAAAFLSVLTATTAAQEEQRQQLIEVEKSIDKQVDEVARLEQLYKDLQQAQKGTSSKELIQADKDLTDAKRKLNEQLATEIALRNATKSPSFLRAQKKEQQARTDFQRELKRLKSPQTGAFRFQGKELTLGQAIGAEPLTEQEGVGLTAEEKIVLKKNKALFAATKKRQAIQAQTPSLVTEVPLPTIQRGPDSGGKPVPFKFDVTTLDRYRSALEAIEAQYDNSAKTAEDLKRAELARQAALANALSDTSFELDTMSGAVQTLGDDAASATDKVRALGSGITGLGSTLGTLLDSPALASQFGIAGAGLGLIGAAGGLFESLFDSSESQESILNQQLDLQREQFNFAKEQAGIEKKFFEDELEIIRLRAKREGTDPNEALANAITERLRALGFTEEISIENLELQRQRVKNESEEILRNKRLLSRVQNLSGGSGGVGQLVANLQEIRREAGLAPGAGNIGDIINDTIVQLTARTQTGTAQDIQDLLEEGLRLEPPGAPRLGTTPTTPTAPTTLQQVQPRGFSFLDISRGGLQTALGFAPSRAVEMISGAGVPGQIGSLTVATEAMKTTEEKMLDTLDGQLSELKKQTDILSKLTGQDVTIAVLNAISAGQARSL